MIWKLDASTLDDHALSNEVQNNQIKHSNKPTWKHIEKVNTMYFQMLFAGNYPLQKVLKKFYSGYFELAVDASNYYLDAL